MRTELQRERSSLGSSAPQSSTRQRGTGRGSYPHHLSTPRDRLLFSARRHVSNGTVPNITHIVYVDPEQYARLGSLEALQSVGRAVSKLNTVLPKRQFILMGPGRWGSRGDVKLGISVTYSDINNTAMLIEIARRVGMHQLYAEILTTQPQVIKAFQDLGFRPEVTLGDYFMMNNGETLDMTILALQLVDHSGEF